MIRVNYAHTAGTEENSVYMNISLEYYKVFYYVAEYGSLTAAAEQLCISQPAVSQAVHQLEKELGCRLFNRGRKGAVLTTEGRVLSSYVKKGYEHIKQGEESVLKMINMDTGEIRIGASDMTLQFFLLPFLEQFHELYPDIKVNVTNGPTPETLKYLGDGKIDFGVVTTPLDKTRDYTVKEVRKIRDVFIAGREFSYLKGKRLKYEDLVTLPVICLEKNTSTRKYLDEFLEKKNIVLEPEFELATSDMIVQFTMRNLGIGCVVYDFAKPYIESGEIFELDFEEDIRLRSMCIVSDDSRMMSVAGGKMLGIISKGDGKSL